jgi:nucleoid-associated protein YgaU
MRVVSFVKDAGMPLFDAHHAEGAAARAQLAPHDTALQIASATANVLAAAAIEHHVAEQGLAVAGLVVSFDAASGLATVCGAAASPALLEKVLRCVGNVQGVAQVEDQMAPVETAVAARWHLVAGGDTLAAIAKAVYGNPTQYMKIFLANRPMLGHPDRIYPGQMLRLPAHRARGQAPCAAQGRP